MRSFRSSGSRWPAPRSAVAGDHRLGGSFSLLDSSCGTFRQLYMIDRNSVYGMIAGPKAGDNEAEIDRFFGSLRINKR